VTDTGRQFTDVVETWEWLNHHPAFDFEAREIVVPPNKRGAKDWVLVAGAKEETRVWFQDNTFNESLSVEFVRVNPQTGAIDEDASKNTQIEVWLEAGGPVADEETGVRYRVSNNYKLACGGPTFEAAMLQMAANVLKQYGDYMVDEHVIQI
jgi:hypothetical protein